MRGKLQMIQEQIHTLIDIILAFNMESHLPELVAKHIALQNMIISFQTTDKEINHYFSDEKVADYVKKYQRYCLNLEVYLENLMTDALMKPNRPSEIIRLLRNYYSSIYEVMSKNEIALAGINKSSKVCMVGVGSMPLSMLFMHRFSGASVVGIDKSKKTILSTQKCIEFISQHSPDRYRPDAFSVVPVDGEEFNYANFDVIVLSIHIENKDAVIRRILDTVVDKKRFILLDRKVVGLSQYFYKNNPSHFEKKYFITGDVARSGVISAQALIYHSDQNRG